MKVCILMGSPRKNGNTQALLKPFITELENNNYICEIIWLYEKNIAACTACRTCQQTWDCFGCRFHDDAYDLFDRVLACDMIVLATPIYSWYCTPPMKSLLDRFVYGMNKYYGEEKGPSLWKGKKVTSIETCGYPAEKGADLWEQGLIRYCKHSQLNYLGMLTEHDNGYKSTFMSETKKQAAVDFAKKIMEFL